MALWVASGCGFRPLPRIICPKQLTPPINSISTTTPSPSNFNLPRTSRFSLHHSNSNTNWALNVLSASPPFWVQEQEEENVGNEFDPGAPPPFKLSDVRAAIPKHCWVKDPWRSMSYVARDVGLVFGLAAVAAYFNSWFVWPLYWFAQGTMFWALFVLGHDCGHGSFSNDTKLNSVVGHLLHSSILVPRLNPGESVTGLITRTMAMLKTTNPGTL